MNETQYISELNGYKLKDKKLTDTFNISVFENYTYTDFTIHTSTGVRIRDNSRITIARNADGSIAKIYGFIAVYNDSADDASNYLSIQSNLRPAEDITINCLGMRFAISTYLNGNIDGGYWSDVTIKTTGEIRFPLSTPTSYTYTWAQYMPCLLFIKDFGDTPIE